MIAPYSFAIKFVIFHILLLKIGQNALTTLLHSADEIYFDASAMKMETLLK